MFELAVATRNDVEGIQAVLYPHYFNESTFNDLSYDEDMTRMKIISWLDDIALIARVEGKVVAVAAMGFLRSFYKEVEADVDMFFVMPDFRGTGIARALADSLVQTAERNKASVMYSSCLSGINEHNTKLYENLWAKHGFVKLGTVMIKGFNHG